MCGLLKNKKLAAEAAAEGQAGDKQGQERNREVKRHVVGHSGQKSVGLGRWVS